MRTIADLPEEQIRALDAYSKKYGVSRAEAVRRAVANFLPRRHGDWTSGATRRSALGKIVMWIQSNTKGSCALNGTIAREGRN